MKEEINHSRVTRPDRSRKSGLRRLRDRGVSHLKLVGILSVDEIIFFT